MPDICFIDDDRGPIDHYVSALELEFTPERVRRIMSLPEAEKHLMDVLAGKASPAKLYIIDIMMPPVREDLVVKTNDGLTSGLYLLELFEKAQQAGNIPQETHVLMMTAVSNPEILHSIGDRKNVDVLAKLEWLPSEFACEARKHLPRTNSY
jgi:CheY-like chemotaxis protein